MQPRHRKLSELPAQMIGCVSVGFHTRLLQSLFSWFYSTYMNIGNKGRRKERAAIHVQGDSRKCAIRAGTYYNCIYTSKLCEKSESP